MKSLLIIFCALLLLQACKKQKEAPTVCILPSFTGLIKTQTQCADAWGYGKNSEETIDLLKAYLLKKNIVVQQVVLQSTGEQISCDACTCSRGFAFYVFADEQYNDKLIKEGFVKE